MARRHPDRSPALPDLHLWYDVAGTVTPLRRPRRRAVPREAVEPSPAPSHKARKTPATVSAPVYRPDGGPGRAPGHGIEPGIRKRLQRGTIAVDGTIDLHGMRQAEARAALARFIHARVARGDRTVLVITGKGLKKLGRDAAVVIEAGVLRTMLPIWLSEPNLAPVIAGWEVAAQAHGGEGAYYVRLRRTVHGR